MNYIASSLLLSALIIPAIIQGGDTNHPNTKMLHCKQAQAVQNNDLSLHAHPNRYAILAEVGYNWDDAPASLDNAHIEVMALLTNHYDPQLSINTQVHNEKPKKLEAPNKEYENTKQNRSHTFADSLLAYYGSSLAQEYEDAKEDRAHIYQRKIKYKKKDRSKKPTSEYSDLGLTQQSRMIKLLFKNHNTASHEQIKRNHHTTIHLQHLNNAPQHPIAQHIVYNHRVEPAYSGHPKPVDSDDTSSSYTGIVVPCLTENNAVRISKPNPVQKNIEQYASEIRNQLKDPRVNRLFTTVVMLASSDNGAIQGANRPQPVIQCAQQ